MKTSKFTEEQVAYALRLSDAGTPVSDVCRQMGISEATFYVWRKKYADLGVAELRQLRPLTEKNAHLKRIVDPRAIPRQHGALLRAGEDHACKLVLPQPGEGPVGAEDAHSRDCEYVSTVRLRAHHRPPARLQNGLKFGPTSVHTAAKTFGWSCPRTRSTCGCH